MYAISLGSGPADTAVVAIDIASGRRRRVATLGKRWWWGMALSPDERTLLVPAINAQGSDLMVVEPGESFERVGLSGTLPHRR